MEPPYSSSHSFNSSMKMAIPASQRSDVDRSSELRGLDCNLTSLCDHIQMEGFNSGAFSDIVVHATGSTYHLHRLILSRSSYFRNMLHGPWKEATAPVVTLHVDDKNVNGEAIAMALAYMYGHQPKLTDNNAFRVLAAASFLDLQDLCGICTDFVISELWTSNFLAYQVFAEGQDYGIHGERVRNACWGYLCQSGALELKEVLPKLSAQTLHALLTSDELWVPSEEKRFELALYTFLLKGSLSKSENSEHGGSTSESGSETCKAKEIFLIDSCTNTGLQSELGHLSLKGSLGVCNAAQNLPVELPGCVINSQTGISNYKQQMQQTAHPPSNLEPRYACNMEGTSPVNSSYSDTNGIRTCSFVDMTVSGGVSGLGVNEVTVEGPSEEGSFYDLDNNSWLPTEQPRHFSLENSSSNGPRQNDWGSCGMHALSWGGRVVGRSQLKSHANGSFGICREEYETFDNIFEGGSLLYCNMSFEALLSVRKQLEELGFPCKAVNDGLWLQMLLSQKVQEISFDSCKNCCLPSMMCACMQPYGFARGVDSSGYYVNEHGQNNSGNLGNIYVTDSEPTEASNGLFRRVRVHVRGPVEGLAGIGRGTTFVPASAWPPTRFVFSRVPFGIGNRNSQQSLANDDSDARAEHNGELSGDGLTALVGLSQGGSSATTVQGEPIERGYEIDQQSRLVGASVAGPSTTCVPVQIHQSAEHHLGIDWENGSSSISLDERTPLSHFPPFRFGVQFEYVHRLGNGQVKHSPEFFYAGSLWKVSVQAFGDEDPQGRRTLGLFLHRRKAETTVSHRKVIYVDSREKVTARYQLICPSKREVMVFGNFKQTGTLLPKAPKGWGWRTAILFDELIDLLQNGCLRVAAVVQLV